MSIPLQFAVPMIAIAATGAFLDLRCRRIPNLLVGIGLLLALAVHAVTGGWHGVGFALAGMLVAGGLFLPGWLAGWMGAGDVKLIAVVGAWLGFGHGALAALLSFIAGGVLAIVVALRRGVLWQSLWGAASLAAWVAASSNRAALPQPPTSGIRFPFAMAVLAGSVAALWVRS